MSHSESQTDQMLPAGLAEELSRIQSLSAAEAIVALRQLLVLFPASVVVQLRLAAIEFRSGGIASARSILKKVLEADEGNAEALELLGDFSFETGKYRESAQYYRRLCRCRYAHYQSRVKLADALLRCNKIAEAAEAYRLATSMPGVTIEAFHGYARVLVLLEKFTEALRVYEVATGKFPRCDFSVELAELQEQMEVVSAKRTEEGLSTLALIARCRKLCDPFSPMEASTFRQWALSLAWFANCGKSPHVSSPSFKWFDPHTEMETEIRFVERRHDQLPLEIDAVKGARKDQLNEILEEITDGRMRDLALQTEELEGMLLPIVQESIGEIVKRIACELELEEEEEDELRGRFSLARCDALGTASIIFSMLEIGFPVPPDLAIVWFWFAQGHWCFDYQLDRELPTAELKYADYIRELTKDSDAAIWQDIVYLVL